MIGGEARRVQPVKEIEEPQEKAEPEISDEDVERLGSNRELLSDFVDDYLDLRGKSGDDSRELPQDHDELVEYLQQNPDALGEVMREYADLESAQEPEASSKVEEAFERFNKELEELDDDQTGYDIDDLVRLKFSLIRSCSPAVQAYEQYAYCDRICDYNQRRVDAAKEAFNRFPEHTLPFSKRRAEKEAAREDLRHARADYTGAKIMRQDAATEMDAHPLSDRDKAVVERIATISEALKERAEQTISEERKSVETLEAQLALPANQRDKEAIHGALSALDTKFSAGDITADNTLRRALDRMRKSLERSEHNSDTWF